MDQTLNDLYLRKYARIELDNTRMLEKEQK